HIRKLSHGTIGPVSVQRALIGRNRKFLAVSLDSTDASSAVEDDGTFAAFLDTCEEDAHRQLGPFSSESGDARSTMLVLEKTMHYETRLPAEIREEWKNAASLPEDPQAPLFKVRELAQSFLLGADILQTETNYLLLSWIIENGTGGNNWQHQFKRLECSRSQYADTLASYISFLVRIHAEPEAQENFAFPDSINVGHVNSFSSQLADHDWSKYESYFC
ncbi:MAG TPA: hypothetical protein VGD31_10700, partial [Sphingobacteriaceae bacterium]